MEWALKMMGFAKKQDLRWAASQIAMRGACALVLWVGFVPVARADDPMKTVSRAEFRGDVARLQGLVAGCAKAVPACDAAKIGPDERVEGAAGFEMHWGWLRSALQKAKAAKPEEQKTLVAAAADHLAEIAQQSETAGGTSSEFAKARAEATQVLSAEEFHYAEPTWWDRLKIRVQGWLAKLFQGAQRVGTMVPWLGTALEWLLFVIAAVVLVVYLLRNLRRQRLRVALGDSAASATAWDREATDWAAQAETHARAGEFREAVHCLYWAAIVALEARRAWRHNPTRTPREYVRLLKAGSARQKGLRGLTQIFERTWYGLRDADAAEYARARGLYDGLAAGSDEAKLEALTGGPIATGGTA
jgi:hypothetical protein